MDEAKMTTKIVVNDYFLIFVVIKYVCPIEERI